MYLYIYSFVASLGSTHYVFKRFIHKWGRSEISGTKLRAK